MIRPTVPDDTPALLELTAGTDYFQPHEVETLRAVLDDYFAGGPDEQHCCYTYEADGRALGYVYFGNTAMTDRTWYVWWIAVGKQTQGRGVGRELLRFAEDEARRQGGRVMFIETSGLPVYEPTRRFYLKNGYEQEARLRDFYRDGDDLVVFRKRLVS